MQDFGEGSGVEGRGGEGRGLIQSHMPVFLAWCDLRETMHLAKQMMYVPDDLFDQDPGINCMLLMTFRRLLPDCFCSQGNDRSGRVLQSKKPQLKAQ